MVLYSSFHKVILNSFVITCKDKACKDKAIAEMLISGTEILNYFERGLLEQRRVTFFRGAAFFKKNWYPDTHYHTVSLS